MDCTQSDTGESQVTIRTRSGKCRWYRINTPIYVAVYHCLEARTVKQTAKAVFGRQHVQRIGDSSARDTNLFRLSETPDSDKLGDDGAKSNSDAADVSVHRPPSPKLKSVTAPFQKVVRTFRYGTFDRRLSIRAGYRVNHRLRA